MDPQLLIIHHNHIEDLQNPIKNFLIQNIIIVKGSHVAVINQMLNKIALLKDGSHLIDLLWGEG